MSSLNKILKKWETEDNRSKQDCVTQWLNSQDNELGVNFKENLKIDCNLPAKAANKLAKLLSRASKQNINQFKNDFRKWAHSHCTLGPKCPDPSGRLFARVVTEDGLNASLVANGREELSEDDRKDRDLVAERLREIEEYPRRDVKVSVWCTWNDEKHPCSTVFKIYENRKMAEKIHGGSKISPVIPIDPVVKCLALPKDFESQTLYILFYQLPDDFALHMPTVADAGYNNNNFLPKSASDPCGKTRADDPCYEGVHTNCSLSRLESVEIAHPSRRISA